MDLFSSLPLKKSWKVNKHCKNISFFAFFTFLLLIRKDVRQNILTFERDRTRIAGSKENLLCNGLCTTQILYPFPNITYWNSPSKDTKLVRKSKVFVYYCPAYYLKKLLNFWDPGWASDKNDFVDFRLVELGVPQRPLNRVHRAPEQVSVQLFEASSCDGRVEVDAL